MESKTACFILLPFPTPFLPVKANEMEQEIERARHPLQRKKQSKLRNI